MKNVWLFSFNVIIVKQNEQQNYICKLAVIATKTKYCHPLKPQNPTLNMTTHMHTEARSHKAIV